MLDLPTIKKIESFVSSKPRSVQEIAQHLGKNWRTADRYIEEIEKEYGTISSRTFRGGTRGALKIVYWASLEKISSSVFQEQLEETILRAQWKEDFSAFDIYQYVSDKYKKVRVVTESPEEKAAYTQITSFMQKAQKQLLIFSGNLSFLNFKQGEKTVLSFFDELVKKGISIKVLCRVDINGKKNVESLLNLNKKYGKELVEIRHHRHPLRATIVDRSFFDIKEIREPTGLSDELDKKLFIFYQISDKEWVDWLTRIFWRLFSSSLDAGKRLFELQKLKQR